MLYLESMPPNYRKLFKGILTNQYCQKDKLVCDSDILIGTAEFTL